MERHAVLDISTLLWDVNDYAVNRPAYYRLMEVLPNLFSCILENRIRIVFRPELSNQVHAYFPYDTIPNEYYDFQVSTLQFLSHVLFEEYDGENDAAIACNPNLVKPFFTQGTQAEVRYLITYLYTKRESKKGILSFKHFWGPTAALHLQNAEIVRVKVDLCDNSERHKKILLKFKKEFKHNPKHNKYKSSKHAFKGEVISKLSCFNERTGKTAAAQLLLDESTLLKGHHYAYDNNNGTWVKFVLTGGNKFHGYDVRPSEHDQNTLRKTFNK